MIQKQKIHFERTFEIIKIVGNWYSYKKYTKLKKGLLIPRNVKETDMNFMFISCFQNGFSKIPAWTQDHNAFYVLRDYKYKAMKFVDFLITCFVEFKGITL
jgi:hypothetical protein